MTYLPTYTLAALMTAGPASAELRPAPEYFVGAIISTDLAHAIAANCPKLNVNETVVKSMSENVLAWLEDDGFDETDPASGMVEFSDQLFALQQRFMDKHKLQGANSAQVCAAGIKEIAANTDVGNLLMEVAP